MLRDEKLKPAAKASMLVAKAKTISILKLLSGLASAIVKDSYIIFPPMKHNNIKEIQWSIGLINTKKAKPISHPVIVIKVWNTPKATPHFIEFSFILFLSARPLANDTAKASIESANPVIMIVTIDINY